jgi:hypothetical protein
MSIPIFREVEGLSKHVSISGQASAWVVFLSVPSRRDQT